MMATEVNSIRDQKAADPMVLTTETMADDHVLYPEASRPNVNVSLKDRFVTKVTTIDGWFGTYDYKALCMPHLPFTRGRVIKSPFYGPNDKVPIALAALMGLQHFLAVIGGIIAPTLLISGAGSDALNLDEETRNYLVSASMIVSGLMSLLQIIRVRIPKTRYFIGAGLLQITGVSFANLPASQALIGNMYNNGMCQKEILADGTINYLPCPDAFGAILGTQMLCALLTIGISILPPRVIRKMFPKIVTGTVLLVIGATLLSSAMKNWGGGAGPCMSRPETGIFALCPTIYAPNAQVWGGAVNFGLGAAVFFTIIVIELVGSVFLKNISVVIGLLVGCLIASSVGMFDSSGITAAPAATFLWVKTFKLSIYAPGIIPFLFVYLDMAIECLGDLTAACDVSGIEISGKSFEERCQGSLLADGFSGIFSGLATSMGVVTFSQNNGIIAVTRCANRYAGAITACLLILFGIFSKISAAFLAIPAPLIGGMTVFLFASVATSGVRILGYLEWTRRDRVVVAASLAIALGTTLVPDWFSHVLPETENPALQGVFDAIRAVVSTGYIMAGIMTILLNSVLPYEAKDDDSSPESAASSSAGGADRFLRGGDNDDEEAVNFSKDTMSTEKN